MPQMRAISFARSLDQTTPYHPPLRQSLPGAVSLSVRGFWIRAQNYWSDASGSLSCRYFSTIANKFREQPDFVA